MRHNYLLKEAVIARLPRADQLSHWIFRSIFSEEFAKSSVRFDPESNASPLCRSFRSFVAGGIKPTPDRGSPWNFREISSEEIGETAGDERDGRAGRNQEVNTSG